MSGVKISDLLAETRSATVKTGGGEFNIVYHAWWETRFVDDEWDRVRQLEARPYLLEVLPRLLVSWDLEDDDGNPLQITSEAIDSHSLPTRLLSMIHEAIVDSVAVGKANSSN